MEILSPYNLILMMSLIALIHELGHFCASLLLRVQVSKFIFGIGPEIFSRSFCVQGVPFSFAMNLIPLGGALDICDDSFERTTLSSQVLVLISGALFNLVTAMLGLLYIFWYWAPSDTIVYPGTVVYFLGDSLGTIGRLIVDAVFNTSYLTVQDLSTIRTAHQFLSTNQNLWFLALFSFFSALSGVLNLLPLPGLDGGRLVSSIMETLHFTSKTAAEMIHQKGIKLITWLSVNLFIIQCFSAIFSK